MFEIKFDKTCMGWNSNPEHSKAFIDANRNYIFERLYTRGYVYLNEIYETFGIEWDPKRDNVCYQPCNDGLGILVNPAENGTFVIMIF